MNNNYSLSAVRNAFARAINPYAIVVSNSSQLGADTETNEVEGNESDVEVSEETNESSETSSGNSLGWLVGGMVVIWLLTRE